MAEETAAERVADALEKTADQLVRQLHQDGWGERASKVNDPDYRAGYRDASRDAARALREGN